MKKYLAFMLIPLLFACSESANKSDSSGSNVDQQPQNPQLKASLSGETTIQPGAKLTLLLEVEELSNDDALYIKAKSFDQRAIAVNPSSALIYPTAGKASLALTVQALDLTSAQNIDIELLTSQGDVKTLPHTVGLAK